MQKSTKVIKYDKRSGYKEKLEGPGGPATPASSSSPSLDSSRTNLNP